VAGCKNTLAGILQLFLISLQQNSTVNNSNNPQECAIPRTSKYHKDLKQLFINKFLKKPRKRERNMSDSLGHPLGFECRARLTCAEQGAPRSKHHP